MPYGPPSLVYVFTHLKISTAFRIEVASLEFRSSGLTKSAAVGIASFSLVPLEADFAFAAIGFKLLLAQSFISFTFGQVPSIIGFTFEIAPSSLVFADN